VILGISARFEISAGLLLTMGNACVIVLLEISNLAEIANKLARFERVYKTSGTKEVHFEAVAYHILLR